MTARPPVIPDADLVLLAGEMAPRTQGENGAAGSSAPLDPHPSARQRSGSLAGPSTVPSSSVGDPLEALFPEEGFEDSEDDQDEDLELVAFKRLLGTDWQVCLAACAPACVPVWIRGWGMVEGGGER